MLLRPHGCGADTSHEHALAGRRTPSDVPSSMQELKRGLDTLMRSFPSLVVYFIAKERAVCYTLYEEQPADG